MTYYNTKNGGNLKRFWCNILYQKNLLRILYGHFYLSENGLILPDNGVYFFVINTNLISLFDFVLEIKDLTLYFHKIILVCILNLEFQKFKKIIHCMQQSEN